MKKLTTLIALTFLLLPINALAFFGRLDNSIVFKKYQVRLVSPITIHAENANEITAKNGISIVIPDDAKILWDNRFPVTAESMGVAAGLIAENVPVEFSANYHVAHIPVLKDFVAGDEIILIGLYMRAYQYTVGEFYLGYDTNGDLVPDYTNGNTISVSSSLTQSDYTPPYPPTALKYSYDATAKSLKLSWQNPPDYDFMFTRLDKNLGGIDISSLAELASPASEYTDTNVQFGDKITYTLYANDQFDYQKSDPASITIDWSTLQPAPVTEPSAEVQPPKTEEPTPPAEKTEIEKLTSLYNYYKARHEIRCGAGRDVNGAGCLWAKIDLTYTQEILGRSDVTVGLSARDLYLMRLRVKWPEQRYQTKCVEASMPDKTCPTLTTSLKRIHYFIDKP